MLMRSDRLLRVILVEDDSAVRETLRDTVPWTQYGYTFVGEAGDGEMALPLIRQKRPDVLITDIRMPFMDGLALGKLVSREFPKTKIIIISEHDDFEYARQAIDIGVERYLLKPVTKNALLPVLEEVKAKLEGERNDTDQFRQEDQDYEQYVRQRFFEEMVSGQLSIQRIYERAEQLDLDLRAQSYTIAFVSLPPQRHGTSEPYAEPGARVRDGLTAYFLKYPEYIPFRWNLTTYAVLIKGGTDNMDDRIQRCIGAVRNQYETYGPDLSWYVAVGKPTQRLSKLPGCFSEASRLWAYRHIFPAQHVLTVDNVSFLTGTDSEHDLADLDAGTVNPAAVTAMLQSAGIQEVSGFVDEYILGMKDALNSKPFCQYLMLSARFTATEFVRSLEISPREFLSALNCLDMVGRNVTVEDLKRYLSDIFLRAIELRDNAAGRQYRSLLKQAVAYIDVNFQREDLSLNRVAKEVNISANYLSALFSQEMNVTFVEYVTGKRMEQARELLRSTKLRSGEVAAAVGYRDPHYFSFLFKKTQGCTPRDYRAGGGKK